MSNICAGIGRGQMAIANVHIAHHQHIQKMYEEQLKEVTGVTVHCAPSPDYDSNYWLCVVTLDPNLKIKGQEDVYKEIINTTVGGAAGVIHMVDSPKTDCQPNENVEALRLFMLSKRLRLDQFGNQCTSNQSIRTLHTILTVSKKKFLRLVYVFLLVHM